MHRESRSAELCGFGHTVNRKRVARLMRDAQARHRRPSLSEEEADHGPGPPRAAGGRLVQRDFTASTLDEKWCGDITYVRVGAAWLYVACVIGIRSRRVLGWSMAPHMRPSSSSTHPRRRRHRSDLPHRPRAPAPAYWPVLWAGSAPSTTGTASPGRPAMSLPGARCSLSRPPAVTPSARATGRADA